MKKIALLVTFLIVTSFFQPALAQDAATSTSFDAAKLEKYLTVKAALLGISDNMSLYFEDLSHSEEIVFNPTRSWVPASTIKAFVLPEVFRERQLGVINFDQKVTISADNVAPTQMESDEFPTLTEGTVVTIKQLVEMMITQSDNTAYNTILDILDRRNINSTLRHLGLTETVVGQKLNLDDSQSQKDANVPGYQLNTTTAKDFSGLFSLLYDKEIPDSDEILAIFEHQKINDMIPALLPKNTTIAHKTGTWNPIFHDGGIVFKPGAPFLLTIFTNSNDPNAVAQLAKVAYFQTASSVTSPETNVQSLNTNPSPPNTVYLASDEENRVLAASTTKLLNTNYVTQAGDTLESIADQFYGDSGRAREILNRNPKIDPQNLKPGVTLIIPNVPGIPSPDQKFPRVTAADLGITNADLTIGKDDVTKIPYALITPDSLLYGLKTWWQNRQLANAKTDQEKIAALLSLSQSRLSEIKTLSRLNNIQPISTLLDRSQFYLIEAADLSKNLPNKNELLFKIGQQNDAQMAILGTAQPQPANQEKFIDTVYNFSQKQKDQLAPKIASIKANNVLAQTPIVGEVTSVSENTVTLKTADGQTQTIGLTALTPVRQFQNKNLENTNTLQFGSKIAVIGQIDKDGRITPRFVLDNVPAELPTRHQGTVTKVDPGNQTIEIQESNGKKDEIKTSNETAIKAKDTEVGLPGIRTGSQVAVFGQTTPPSTSTAPHAPTTIKATSVTITTNGSGKGEKQEKPKEKKPEGKPKSPSEKTNKKGSTIFPNNQLANLVKEIYTLATIYLL